MELCRCLHVLFELFSGAFRQCLSKSVTAYSFLQHNVPAINPSAVLEVRLIELLNRVWCFWRFRATRLERRVTDDYLSLKSRHRNMPHLNGDELPMLLGRHQIGDVNISLFEIETETLCMLVRSERVFEHVL